MSFNDEYDSIFLTLLSLSFPWFWASQLLSWSLLVFVTCLRGGVAGGAPATAVIIQPGVASSSSLFTGFFEPLPHYPSEVLGRRQVSWPGTRGRLPGRRQTFSISPFTVARVFASGCLSRHVCLGAVRLCNWLQAL